MNEIISKEEIAKRVIFFRCKKNISQKEMATVLNIKQSAYSQKESGKNAFSLDDLQKICNYLQISMKEVIF